MKDQLLMLLIWALLMFGVHPLFFGSFEKYFWMGFLYLLVSNFITEWIIRKSKRETTESNSGEKDGKSTNQGES
jgi:hypothetical protein